MESPKTSVEVERSASLGGALTSKWNWIWPDVRSVAGAQWAISESFWATVLVAAGTVFFVLLSAFGFPTSGVDAWALSDATVFAFIAWGIRRRSRTASLVGLLLYIVERAGMWTGNSKNVAVPIFVAFALLQGVRGAFAYHKIAEGVETPSDAPSASDGQAR